LKETGKYPAESLPQDIFLRDFSSIQGAEKYEIVIAGNECYNGGGKQ